MRAARIIYILFVAFLGFMPKSAFAGGGFSILFSGSSNGILSSCYCPAAPWGGLAKRAWLINHIRQLSGHGHVVLVDSGDLFPVDYDLDRNLLLLHLYDLMRYDAVGVGDQELTGGYQKWIKVNQKAGFWDEERYASTFSWLSGSYRFVEGPRARQMLADPWTIIHVNGYRVGVVSVAGPESYRFNPNKLDGIELLPPISTIHTFIGNYGTEIDFVLVLSHQGAEQDRLLASQLEGVDLIVGGHSQSLLSPPEVINGVAIVQAGKNGENLGLLHIVPAIPETSSEDRSGVSVENPFIPTITQTARWRIVQQLIPLDTRVDEDPEVARRILEYRMRQDMLRRERAMERPPSNDAPRIVLRYADALLNMHAGESKEVNVFIRNEGDAPLVIESIRSRIRWLDIVDYPREVLPGEEGQARLRISANSIDRHFRSEFAITSNDPSRRVTVGAFYGRIEGNLPKILDIAALWEEILQHAENNGSLETEQKEKNSELPKRITLTYFFAPGCPDCELIERLIIPEIDATFGDFIEWFKLDVTQPEHYAHLRRLEEMLNVQTDESISIYVDHEIVLHGIESIKVDLFQEIAGRLVVAR